MAAKSAQRALRQAIEEASGLDVYRPWLAAKFRRVLALTRRPQRMAA